MGNNILKFILDIGNSKIKMLAGELSEDGSKLKILKHVEVDSEGIKKSIIESPALLSESIRKAKELIEADLKLNIEKVNLGIGGTKVCSRTTNIKLSFEEEKEIKELDLNKLYELAKDELKYSDEEILKKEYYNLRVDNAGIVKNPIGLSGKELQGDIHLVLTKSSDIEALKEVVIRSGMEIESICFNAYAASRATLSFEDKDKGVALIDIGEGTTDIIIYKNNKMIYVKSLSLGGMHYISDLEYIYKISKEEALKIMDKALSSNDLEETFIIANRKVSTKNIIDAINARTDDFVKFIRNTIQDSGFTGYLGKGICLTGGVTRIDETYDWIKGNLGYSVKRAYPISISGIEDSKPEMSVCIGILIEVMEEEYNKIEKNKKLKEKEEKILKQNIIQKDNKEEQLNKKLEKERFKKIKMWFSNFI